MDIGIAQPVANKDARAVEIAKHAEDLGFESYWAPDHTILPVDYSVSYPGGGPDDPEPEYLWQMADPLMLLANIAGATSKIKLGTGGTTGARTRCDPDRQAGRDTGRLLERSLPVWHRSRLEPRGEQNSRWRLRTSLDTHERKYRGHESAVD